MCFFLCYIFFTCRRITNTVWTGDGIINHIKQKRKRKKCWDGDAKKQRGCSQTLSLWGKKYKKKVVLCNGSSRYYTDHKHTHAAQANADGASSNQWHDKKIKFTVCTNCVRDCVQLIVWMVAYAYLLLLLLFLQCEISVWFCENIASLCAITCDFRYVRVSLSTRTRGAESLGYCRHLISLCACILWRYMNKIHTHTYDFTYHILLAAYNGSIIPTHIQFIFMRSFRMYI